MQISLILMREIVQLFIILLMGYIIVRAKLLRPEDSRSLSVVMVYLLTPCVIINAFQVEYTPQVMAGLIFSFAISIAAHILFLLLTRLLAGPLHLDVIERTAVIYTNAGILVIPLVTVLLLRAAGAAGWIADGKNILMIVYLACITPACATVTSLAQLYDRNAAYSSALYVLTTLLSIVTMPVMIGVYDALI